MEPDPTTAALHGARLVACAAGGPIWRFDDAHPPRLSVWPPPRGPLRLTLDGAAGLLDGPWRLAGGAAQCLVERRPAAGSGLLALHDPRGLLGAWAVDFDPPPDHPLLRAARARRAADDYRGALAVLDAAGDLDPLARLAALELRARLYRDLGALTESAAIWEEGARHAAALELPGEAARRWRAAAFIDLVRRLFVDAERRADLARAALAGFDDPPDAMRTAYLDGLLAEARADYRGAARHLERAHRLAVRLDADERGAIAAQRGLVELRLGRLPAARALLAEAPSPGAAVHERINHRLQRAWLACHEHLAGADPDALGRARAEVEAARGALPPRADLRLRAGCALTAGWIALLDGRLADARRAHDAADALHRRLAAMEPGRDYLAPARGLLDGRLLLAEGRIEAARARFAALVEAERAVGGLPSPVLWAALHGLGAAHRAAGATEAALAAWQAALAEIDRAVVDLGRRRTPSFLTAITLLDAPAQLADDLVDLLAERAPDRAFAEADAAAVRRQRTLQVEARLARLPPPERARYDRLLDALARRMEAHEATRADWSTPPADLAPRLAATGAAVRAAFDRAVRVLEAEAPTPELACDPAALAPALGPDEALLACRPRADRRVEAWWLRAGRLERVVGVPLPALVAARLDGLAHLHVVAGGLAEAWRLPEALVDGRPLAARVGLGYLPHAGLLLRPRPAPGGSVAVLVDPEGDLPLARADGRWLAERLRAQGHAVRLSAGDAVDRAAMRAALGSAAALHFGGHGAPEPDAPDQSHLRLARDGSLHAEDVVALGRAPARLVLEGCWTGLGFGVGAMSLPAACLMAGACSVLATVEPLDAEAASRFVRRLYRHGALWHPAAALRAATAESVDAGESGWRGWRLSGQP